MMGKSSPLFVIVLYCVAAVSSITILTINSYADYPWVYYFKRPDMAEIHTAFPDGDGRVIVATGDWRDWHSVPGYNVWEYFSTGVYRIDGANIEDLNFPANSYVFDGALDSEGRLWILIGEGQDDWDKQYGNAALKCLASGFNYYRSGAGPINVVNRRLCVLEECGLVECSELTEAIPGEARWMGADPHGRIFVLSELRDGYNILDTCFSWWEADAPQVVHTAVMSEVFAQRIGMSGYPFFDRHGCLYTVVISEPDDPGDIYDYAVIRFNPDTFEWHLFDENESEFLDSAIAHFFIDPMDVKWFGTGDGLVRFDGENWSRFTTENSQLPFNVVVEMAYEEQDDVYYVISQERWEYGDYDGAFSIFSSTGQLCGAPVGFSPPAYSLPWRWIFKDSNGVWWLHVRHTNTVYSYDHRRVMQWDVEDWTDSSDAVGYIGGTASGRTFAVCAKWLMIW